ncbi:sensor histidine kinase [Pseudocnuella soli]|uniref:sensor histidine kinase n=1 Tax=Pseudocnuella soli TaxID=2502779 RepID=UPI00104EDDED|nr:histidine kinase [Pseudocnuella soli]
MNRWPKPTQPEWLAFSGLTVLMAVVLHVILFGANAFVSPGAWLLSFPFICVQGLTIWYLQLLAMHALRRKLPHIGQTGLRIALLVVLVLVLTNASFAFTYRAYHATNFLGFVWQAKITYQCFALSLAVTLISTSIWEVGYTFTLWKKSLAQKERLQQQGLEYQFETLKSQVNPHFLFNCFNTLSSLISEEPDRAEAFLNELSKVYRYLLRNNRDSLSTLQAELEFIQSYLVLLQTRHGDAVQLNTKIDKRYNQYLIPSLTLQLLVENAVKHNSASKASPLIIDIFTAAGNILVVTNNVQKRAKAFASHGIGLENIRAKFELMKQPGFQVMDMAQNFTVVLPLIWAPAWEQTQKWPHDTKAVAEHQKLAL